MDDFTALADRIAKSGASSEADLLFCGLALFGPSQGCAESAQLTRLIEVGASTDCAQMLHCLALPHHGFELGRTPASRAFAGSWRDRDTHIATTTAATPALALLRATATALAASRRQNAHAACTLCNGRGWYVTRECRKEICRHD